MEKISAVLFDFDGTIVDTESQYDLFFDDLVKRYPIDVRDFSQLIKGKKLEESLKNDFPSFSEKLKEDIIRETEFFEANEMEYVLVPGVMEFISYLKQNGYKLALVTSSNDKKMAVAMEKLQLFGVFDIEVTSDKVKKGKPNPDCYLLAARELDLPIESCLVFEDSFSGIAAALAAGMRVVGLATSLSKARLQEKTKQVISDFSDLVELRSYLEE